MNASLEAKAIPGDRESSGTQVRRSLDPKRWRQLALISVAALTLFVCIRLLPTGTNLSHMDFRVQAGNSIELCDPLNPQFIPVVAMRSPVTLALITGPLRAGEPAPFTLTLTTSTGKRITSADLLVAHTRKLHLLIIDPSLSDYQHVHPEPGLVAGEWVGSFTPRHGGLYRVFADFTPLATGRSLYAGADLSVAGAVAQPEKSDLGSVARKSVSIDALHFTLDQAAPLRAGQPADLILSLAKADSGSVSLEPIMGAFAHLVAFDEARSGFAHLHPKEIDLSMPPDPIHPRLTFKVTFPSPGRYVVWSQVKVAGQEVFAPFRIEVSR